MLSNICSSPHVLRTITNHGCQDSNIIGDFLNLLLGPVCYNEQSIANILSLSDIRKVCKVFLDISKAPAIKVHRKDGSCLLTVKPTLVPGSNVIAAYTRLTTAAAEQNKIFPMSDPRCR